MAPAASPAAAVSGVAPVLEQLPLAFVPVQGQSRTAVQFEVYGSGNKLTFVPTGAVLEFPGDAQPLRMSYLGANPSTMITAGDPLPGIVNEYRGNQEDGWQVHQTSYASIHYQELYPGINLRYEGSDGSLESIFSIDAGADPGHIRWQYAGSTAIEVDQASGDLRITLADQSQVVEQAPYAWQEIDGQRVPVAVAFELAGDNSVSFALGSYNPAFPLTIDPTIVYETTLNLGYFDGGLDLTTDSAGNVYVLARVYDTNNDVLIAKLSANGTLLFTTYLRGSSGDFGSGITLDSAGDIYVAGSTDSANFPILNASQSVKNGVTRDAFITKIAGDDGSLLFSTFFGGSRSDEIHDITLNSANEIYLVGYTESTDFPTLNPIQAGLNLPQCFCEDTFVTRLTPDAMTVLSSTYLGGAFEDYGQSIALDAAENIYITGNTQSDDFPTQAAIQPNRAGQYQDDDLFVSKISADGSSLVYSTYLGGTRGESARRITVDSAGNAFVGGTTLSADFPTTAGAYQEAYIGGFGACLSGLSTPVDCNDMFVTKIVPDGSSLAYSTYLGGGKHDFVTGITVNAASEAYVVGYTNSSDFPLVAQPGIILAKLNSDGSDLLSAISIPSAVSNAGHGITLDESGDVYITGAQNAPSDLYVAKITDGSTSPLPPSPSPTFTPTPTQTATPAPTATPSPTDVPGSALHVGDLDGFSAATRNNFWQARVIVSIHDADHVPVPGAVVSGTWSGGYTRSDQCTTGNDGRCVVGARNIHRNNASTSFTVDGVTHSAMTYTPAGNHDPDTDSDGTTITVSRP